MFNSIVSFSLNNKIVVFILVILLIAAGIFSFSGLPVDAVPDITNNQVQVVTVAPDLATSEVERFISFPVEQALTTIPGKTELRSLSRFGLSVVTIVFTEQTNIYLARQQIAERLSEIREQIPANMGKPEMMPVTTGLGEIYQYTLRIQPGFESKYTLSELRTIQDWVIKRQLQGVEGVAEISSFGGHLKQYEVAFDPHRLRAMDVSLDQLLKAIEHNNQNAGGAYIEKGPNIWYIRTEGMVNTLTDIEMIEVKRTSSGLPVLVKDLAQVRFGHAIRYGAVTRDTSGETVGGIVLMLKGANSSAVIELVKERIQHVAKTLPEGIEIAPYLDRTKLVNNAIGTIEKNLTEGALIVIFVLVLLLGNLRAGLIVASVIPLSMLFAICMMRIFGVSGNLMSLGAIDFGLIVDGAVIIVEGVIHLMQQRNTMQHHGQVLNSAAMQDTVQKTSGKMIRFAAFGQLIILIVYLPILTLSGIEGKMFRPMAETVSFAIIGALLLSMTWVPVASTLFLSRKISTRKNIGDRIMQVVRNAYLPALDKVLLRPLMFLGIGLVILAGSFFIFSRMGGEFIPVLEEGDFAVEMRLISGSSLSHTIEKTNQASKILMERFPEIIAVTGKIGTAEIPTDPMPPEACDLIITLKEKDEWTSADTREELAEKMHDALQEIPGINFGVQQPIQMRFNELMTGARQDVVVKVYGDNLDTLSAIATQVAAISGEVNGAVDIYQEQLTGLPQQVVRVKRERLARYGISVEQVNQTVNAAFAGQSAGIVFEGDRRFDLVVRMTENQRRDLATMQELTIPDQSGNPVPLPELAEISIQNGPVQIQRDNAIRRALVGFNARGRDVESIVQDVMKACEQQLKLPVGYSIDFGGQFKNLAEAKERLMIAVPVALLLIFLLLHFTFGSVKYALLIFSAVPFSIIGGILALWLRGMPFSISAGVGFIALSGVAVLNGIVLIGMFNQLKNAGETNLKTIIRQGAGERIRPILLTAAVASLGFLPMAISHSPGSEVQKPLATVVIGGLISATLLTLFLLPVLYMLFEKFSMKRTLTKPLMVLLLLGFAGNKASSQTQPVLGLEEAIGLALQHHPAIKQSNFTLQARKAHEKAAFDPGHFSASLMGGQYNSLYSDKNFTLSQTFPFPLTSVLQARFYKSETKEATLSQQQTQKNTVLEVSAVWYELRNALQKKVLLDQENEQFKKAEQVARLRLSSGETNRLEILSVQTAGAELFTEISTLEQQIHSLSNSLQLLTGLSTAPQVSINEADARRDMPVLAEPDRVTSALPYQITMQKQQSALLLNRLEKSRFLPDISAGYFNQSLTGYHNFNGVEQFFNQQKRFTGYQVGLSFPLIFNAQQARAKSALLLSDAATEEASAMALTLKNQQQKLRSEMLSAIKNAEYLEANILPDAEAALKAAQTAWVAGESGYLEMIFLLRQVFQLRLSHLDEINRYNMAILQYEFFFK